MAPETVAGGAGEGRGGGGLQLDAHGEQLFAHIPDHVTLAKIVPKLRWKCLDKLALVSPAWLHAVRSRAIYNARVKCRSLESLVIVRSFFSGMNDTLYLFSTRDGIYMQLPTLPGCEYGIPLECECVTLDGAIYVLGGCDLGCSHVYVLDLAGPRRQWKQCASMPERTMCFTCAALDGKVYVVDYAHFSAVYDPKADTWCLIEPFPMNPLPSIPQEEPIIAVGEELILLSQKPMGVANAADLEFTHRADIYNPAKDEWRVETIYSDEPDESLAVFFAAQGKLHRVRNNNISVLDMDTKRWTLRRSYVLSGPLLHHARTDYGSFGGVLSKPDCIIAVGDEVLAIARAYGHKLEDCLIQSEGFGGKDINIDVTWRDSKFVPSEPDDPNWHTVWELPDLPHQMYSLLRDLPYQMYPIDL